jgi:hypothetical protein
MKLISVILFGLFFSGCRSDPVTNEPDQSEIIGVWECSDFPIGFLQKAGGSNGSITSRVVIKGNGMCTLTNFPERSPYRLVDEQASPWRLIDGWRTPSGSWSVEIGTSFLQCRRKGGDLELRHTISGKDHYFITYERAE